MTTERYNKIVIGFVVQSYRHGECFRQDFIASDEVSREDPASGESIAVWFLIGYWITGGFDDE